MYVGQVRRVERRKPAKCGHCEGEVSIGESCFVVVRNAKSKKGKQYLWTVYIHQDCFLDWTDVEVAKRAKFVMGRKGGRPPGSQVKTLAKENPELALERHKLVREQARLQRYLVVAEGEDRICDLVNRIETIQERLKGILKFQVTKFNRRSEESRQIIKEKTRQAKNVMWARRQVIRTPQPIRPDVDLSDLDDSPEEEAAKIGARIKEIQERQEAYQKSGQVWTEDSRE